MQATYSIRIARTPPDGEPFQTLLHVDDATVEDAWMLCLDMARYFEGRLSPEQAARSGILPRRRRGRPTKEEVAAREATS